jgi:hypothetical protein
MVELEKDISHSKKVVFKQKSIEYDVNDTHPPSSSSRSKSRSKNGLVILVKF